MNIRYPLLIPVIGHGATDIIDFPIETITYNLFSLIFVYNLNYFQRKVCLILFSIFHIAQDIPNKIILGSKIINLKNNKYIISSLFHKLIIDKPILAKLYFLSLHTPLHYLRIIKSKIKTKRKLLVGCAISLLSMVGISKKYDILIENKMNKLWWIFPILPHIILTEKFNKEYIKLKKYNINNIKIYKIHVI